MLLHHLLHHLEFGRTLEIKQVDIENQDRVRRDRAGRLRAIAVTSTKRLPVMPELPTVAESGLPGYALVNSWGIFAPRGKAVREGDGYRISGHKTWISAAHVAEAIQYRRALGLPA